jgi:hypothetical protein
MVPSLTIAATVVDWSQLLRVVEAGLVAGVGVSVAFSLLILGALRAGESRQQQRPIAALSYGALATLGLVVCVGAVVFGVSTMLAK